MKFCLVIISILFFNYISAQTIDEKYQFTLKAVEKNNKEEIFLYMNDILNYEKENGIDTNYLKTLEFYLSYFYSFSDFKNSLKLNKEILLVKENLYGKKSLNYLYTYLFYAIDYYNLEDYTNSLKLNLECLSELELISAQNDSSYSGCLNNIALNYSKLGEYAKSLETNLKCLDLKEKMLGINNVSYLTTYSNLAIDYHNLGEFSKSLEINKICLEKNEKLSGKMSINYATSLNNISDNYSMLGNYKDAIEYNLECVKIRKKILGINHPFYIHTLNNLGLNYKAIGNYSKALEILSDCLITIQKEYGEENLLFLLCSNNLACTYLEIGEYQKALKIFQNCIKIRLMIQGDSHPDYFISLNNLALCYQDLHEYAKALNLYLKCLNIIEYKLGTDNRFYYSTLNNLSLLYIQLGDYEMALHTNTKSLVIIKNIDGELHPDYFLVVRNQSDCYSQLGNYNKSLQINLSILPKIEEGLGKEHPYYLNTLSSLASSYFYIGDLKKSIELNLECIKLTEKVLGTDHPDYFIRINDLATGYGRIGNLNKSTQLLEECLGKYTKLFGSSDQSYITYLDNLAIEYLNSKNFSKSDSCFLMSINQSFKNLNLSGLNHKEQNNFKELFNNKLTVFINYSQNRNNENQFLSKHSFQNYLNLKGIISNQSAQLESQIRASKNTSLIQLFEKWQLNKLQLLKYYELTKPELEKRGINIVELEEEINEQERALSRGSEMFSEMKKTYVLSDIQQQLKEDEAYVDIVRLPYYNFNTNVWSDTIRYLAYIITKDTKEIPTTVLLENGNQLEEEIASYYAENTFGKSKREKDSISYTYFWKSISKELSGKRKVYLSSGGVYNNINIQTLFNPSTNKYVSEELEVQLVNNGRTFIQQKTKKPQVYTKNTATFIGYPNFNGTLSKGAFNEDAFFATTREFSPMLLDTLSRGANVSPLPGTKKEVETIGQLLKTKQWNVSVLTENNASEEEIKKIESPRVLHIATHGYFLQQTDNLQKESGLRIMGMDTKRFVENPLLRSGLLLSGANKTLKGDTTKASENGILTAYEAAYLHLQGTELVVLSACETGKGELKNGEGVYGLRKSFSDAGAKNIIMSLWKVDDKVTQEFMTSFYTNWSTGITIREAFNKTQQSIKALYPQPYYWGAFILVGE
jgi:CHAT domain-containing protein